VQVSCEFDAAAEFATPACRREPYHYDFVSWHTPFRLPRRRIRPDSAGLTPGNDPEAPRFGQAFAGSRQSRPRTSFSRNLFQTRCFGLRLRRWRPTRPCVRSNGRPRIGSTEKCSVPVDFSHRPAQLPLDETPYPRVSRARLAVLPRSDGVDPLLRPMKACQPLECRPERDRIDAHSRWPFPKSYDPEGISGHPWEPQAHNYQSTWFGYTPFIADIWRAIRCTEFSAVEATNSERDISEFAR
jgi:hypothetical protein